MCAAVALDGTNADDTGDHRPGRQAAREHGVRSPLQEAGLTKSEIRAWAAELGLPTLEAWDIAFGIALPNFVRTAPPWPSRYQQ